MNQLGQKALSSHRETTSPQIVENKVCKASWTLDVKKLEYQLNDGKTSNGRFSFLINFKKRRLIVEMTKVVNSVQLITILIGPPCCGKSTYLKSIDFDFIVSSDAIVEDLCQQMNIHYHQFFDYPNTSKIKIKHRKMFANKIRKSKAYEHIVWDLTNLQYINRKKIMSHYPNAQFNAVQFNFKGLEHSLLEINKKRHDSLGKYISDKVMLDMFQRFEPVEEKEGFENIKHIDISKWLDKRISHLSNS